jgi:hypothetical protein
LKNSSKGPPKNSSKGRGTPPSTPVSTVFEVWMLTTAGLAFSARSAKVFWKPWGAGASAVPGARSFQNGSAGAVDFSSSVPNRSIACASFRGKRISTAPDQTRRPRKASPTASPAATRRVLISVRDSS